MTTGRHERALIRKKVMEKQAYPPWSNIQTVARMDTALAAVGAARPHSSTHHKDQREYNYDQ